MKFVISYLLAACAFKAVFLDKLQDDIKKTLQDYQDKIDDNINQLYHAFQVEFKAMHNTNYDRELNCRKQISKSITKPRDSRYAELCKCHDEAIKKKSNEYAKNCSDDIFYKFRKDSHTIYLDSRKCLSKDTYGLQ